MHPGALELSPFPPRPQRPHGAHAHTQRAEGGPQPVERFKQNKCVGAGRRGAIAQARPGAGLLLRNLGEPVCTALRAAAMAAYKLVLIRHGESAWNLENRFSGWYDADLSPAGHEEAKRGGQALRGAERAGLWVGVRNARRAPLEQGRLSRPRALRERSETLGFVSTAVYLANEKMGPGWGIDLLKVTQ